RSKPAQSTSSSAQSTARASAPRSRRAARSGVTSSIVWAAGKRSGSVITRPIRVMTSTLDPGARPHPAQPIGLLEDLQRRHRLARADPERLRILDPLVEVADQQLVGDAPVG